MERGGVRGSEGAERREGRERKGREGTTWIFVQGLRSS